MEEPMSTCKSLREVEDHLPNGLHDAWVDAITLDFAANTARIGLQVWMGNLYAPMGEEREARRKATLWLRDLVYFVVEAPGPDGEWFEGEDGLTIDAGDASDDSNPAAPRPLRPLRGGAFAYWFYVREWNSFIHVAARSAVLEWA